MSKSSLGLSISLSLRLYDWRIENFSDDAINLQIKFLFTIKLAKLCTEGHGERARCTEPRCLGWILGYVSNWAWHLGGVSFIEIVAIAHHDDSRDELSQRNI